MINLAIAIAVSAVLYLGFGFLLGGGDFNPWYGILPGLIGLVAVYLYMMRRTLQQVEVIMGKGQQELIKLQQMTQRPGQRPNPQRVNEVINRAVGIIKGAYKYKIWQFLLEQQINAQIGTLYYMQKDYDTAEPYLNNSFFKNWIAQAMLAVIHFRRRDYTTMEEVFERAVKANKKESSLWALYAWCMWKNKKRDAAIAILTRAKEHSTDKRIEDSRLALQNNQKLDMHVWDQNWYQFQLGRPPQMKMPQQRQAKGSKRSIYR